MLHDGMQAELYVKLIRSPHDVQRVCIFRNPVTGCLHFESVPFSHQQTNNEMLLDDFKKHANDEYLELADDIEQFFEEDRTYESDQMEEFAEHLNKVRASKVGIVFNFLGLRISIRKS